MFTVCLFFSRYDMFLEGEFILYRHKTLPYEVSFTLEIPSSYLFHGHKLLKAILYFTGAKKDCKKV